MIQRLTCEDRVDAMRGLALLAQAASEEMHARSSRTAGSRKQHLSESGNRRKTK
jgi:hypothetical protein